MGCYDGAETCQLVGNFLLSQIQKLNINIGLYRDDGLAISNTTTRDTENIKKEICPIFNQNGQRITIEANKQTILFLDVTFKLNKNTFQPFTKPNTTLQYVHGESNHRPTTTKNKPPASTKGYHPFHLTKHPSTKPLRHTKKPQQMHSKFTQTHQWQKTPKRFNVLVFWIFNVSSVSPSSERYNYQSLDQSLWRRANARNVSFFTLYGG